MLMFWEVRAEVDLRLAQETYIKRKIEKKKKNQENKYDRTSCD